MSVAIVMVVLITAQAPAVVASRRYIPSVPARRAWPRNTRPSEIVGNSTGSLPAERDLGRGEQLVGNTGHSRFKRIRGAVGDLHRPFEDVAAMTKPYVVGAADDFVDVGFGEYLSLNQKRKITRKVTDAVVSAGHLR